MTRPYWWSWSELAEALEAERDDLLVENRRLRDGYVRLLLSMSERLELWDYAVARIQARFPDEEAA